MKQHIDISELNELSPKAKEKLREWLSKRIVINQTYKVQGIEDGWVFPLDLPLLSIGQMIEFLEMKSNGHFPGQNWHEYVIKETEECGDILIPYSVDELCDSLWEAVKQILEK